MLSDGDVIQVCTVAGRSPTLQMTSETARWLGLDVSDSAGTIRVRFGLEAARLPVEIDEERGPGVVGVSAAAAGWLGMPTNMAFRLAASPDGWRTGPFIGMLFSTEEMRRLRRPEHQTLVQHLVQCASEEGGHIVFITFRGVDRRRRRVTGWMWDPTRAGYVRVRTAVPRVVYDRCFGRRGRTEARAFRRRVDDLPVVVLNRPVKLTKWSVYNAVSKDASLRTVVPAYAPLTVRHLVAAARVHPVLYVKPDGLSKGFGVARIARRRRGWWYDFTWRSRPQRRWFPTARRLLRHIRQRYPYPYVMQEGLDLARFHGNAYDFRALVQKDRTGRWQLSGLVARIAPRHGVVTSPRSGGRVAPAARVLAHSFGPVRGHMMLDRIEETSLHLARRLEKVYGLFAEIGLDLGVTRDGQIRLIEANGRPLKVSLERLNDPRINRRMHRYPIHYAASLDLPVNG